VKNHEQEMVEDLAGTCVLIMTAVWTAPVRAQMAEVKEKPPMYSYIGNWNIPRAQWTDMEKSNADRTNHPGKAMANGTIVAYGNDFNLVHQARGPDSR